MYRKYFINWILIRFLKTADVENEDEATNLMGKDDFSITKFTFKNEFVDERKVSHTRMTEETNTKKFNSEFSIKKYDQNNNEEAEIKKEHKPLLIKKNDLADNDQKYWIQENNGLFVELKPEHLNLIKKIKKRINYDSILTNISYRKARKRGAWSFLKYVYTPERINEAFKLEENHSKYFSNQPCTFLDIFQDLKITSYKDLINFNISFRIVCDTIDHLMIFKILSYDIDFYTLRLVLDVIDCTKRLMCSPFSDPITLYFIYKTNKIVCQDESDLVLCYSFALVKNILTKNHQTTTYKFASFFSGTKFKKSRNLKKIILIKRKNDGQVTVESLNYADYIFSHIFNALTFIYDEVFNKV
ncbi:hypothetical protein NBO_48g0002 [Nosema bombycis CQ1]|uniref:Uncharacterized protein n=1 Tax=Nosema bombycis (strain CQ1 / CVCC 102059) TaxID=578461 RepID=R0KUS0_NOSB1|nr:hypothetical protein NBO_48g0002 [Nosema bombycis CQ1]|eukprot:EOB13952.1 hypothetical protein NBO_48g0002 [Nosema bombycis CQ1]